MSSKRTSRSKHLDFILLDLICVELSFLLAYYLRIGRDTHTAPGNYYMMNVLIILVHIAIVFYSESYSGIIRRGYLVEFKKVAIYNCELISIVLVVLFFSKQSSDYSRILLAIFFIINNVLMYIIRSIRKSVLKKTSTNTSKRSRMLLVTDMDHVKTKLQGLKSYNYSSFFVKGIVIIGEDKKGQMISDVEVVANHEDMYEYVRTHVIDEIFIEYSGDDLSKIVNSFLAMGVVVHVSIDKFISNVPNAVLENVNEYTVVSAGINLMSFKQKVIKRLMDIFVSIPGIIVTGILAIILGPIIYLQSPGPILFKQERVGKNGRTFKIYKFRSMYMDAEERKKELMEQNKMSGLMFKMDDDPRVTPIGRFIRKTSLDEFPQFINIFRGDMSLVGTRPPTVGEYNQYEQHHKSRLAIKPGLTGLWQVSGRSDITDFEEIVSLDNEYIKNFSLGFDLKILVKTAGVVFGRKGSV